MKCPNCGREQSGKYCKNCGTFLQELPNKKWYQKTWFTILMLIFFFPVGIVLMWMYREKWHIAVKIAISAFLMLLGGNWVVAVILIIVIVCIQKKNHSPNSGKGIEKDKTSDTFSGIPNNNRIAKVNNPPSIEKNDLVLSAGRYVGGRDIRTGIYDLVVVSGSGIVETDSKDRFHEFLSYEEENSYNNLEISNGTILKIDTRMRVKLYNHRDYTTGQKIQNEEPQVISSQFDNMDGHSFEHFCADVLRQNGYSNVKVTQGSGDQGVDILAERDNIKYAIQCKHYSQSVGNKAVQEIYTGMRFYHCHVGIVMTNNYFTQSAKDLAKENGIVLWDRDYLIKFLGSKTESKNAETYIISKELPVEEEKEEKSCLAETREDCKGDTSMYNKEKGIYPPGVYVVGDDIEIGKYILYAKKGENQDPMVAFYENYSKYRKEEINQLERFDEDYYLSLREHGMVIAVRDAEIRRL